MKTAELTGTALDWAVAKCEGATEEWRSDAPFFWNGVPCIRIDGHDVNYRPSSYWALGGPIIERERLGVWFSEEVHDEDGTVLREACWYCETSCTTDNGDEPYRCDTGATPLEAAMRCYVASKLGDEVEIPAELI